MSMKMNFNLVNTRNMLINNKINNNNSIQKPIEKITHKQIEKQIIKKSDRDKIKWGEPTWFLFHTMAEKVKEEYFLDMRSELFHHILSICGNLPCPKCAKHATEYMKKVDFNSIQSKDDFKKLLFAFHNVVNKEKGYEMFNYEDLDTKYSKAITINIINNFITQFQKKDFNVNMISANMQRDLFMKKFKIWLNNNIQYFDM